MPVNLKKTIGNSRVVLLITPTSTYSQEIIDLLKQLGESYNRICYVSLNRYCTNLKSLFETSKIEMKKFFIIDCVSKDVIGPKKPKNCELLTGPSELNEIKLSVSKNLKAGKCDALFFDSLSTLLLYNDDDLTVKFVRNLVKQLVEANCTAVFTVIEVDKKDATIKKIEKLMDKVVSIKK